jgi:glucose/arabinose dehydrogenase
VLLAVASGRSGGADAALAPKENAYSSQPILTAGYLGPDADNAIIEYAPIPGQPNEALVASQSGYIYRVALNGSFAPVLWGDVHTLLTFNGEQGLMSVAFSPDFPQSGRVYIYYTPGSPNPTVLARFQATATDLNEGSIEPLLSIEEFAANHNGGHIAFDMNGYLYLSLGDGGGGGDPREKGQALNTLLGKVLRLNVSGPSGYSIPAGNPFNDGAGPIREEIFAYGFRNPWRMSVDPVTNDVWLGDVGQGAWEEVDRVVNGGNYGWDCYEGNAAFSDSFQGYTLLPCNGPFLPPRAEYSHSFGAAVTGGVVYRGDDMPELYGWYIYSDFYSGRIWGVNTSGSAPPVQLMDTAWNVSSFTLLPDGEVAIVTYDSGIHRLTGDFDSDGVLNGADNCPEWPNPGQGLPSWPVPVDDSDCDGFADSVAAPSRAPESFLGTNAADQCANTAATNDEPTDAWPPDVNDDRVANLSDVIAFGPTFNTRGPDPPYNKRFDLNASNTVTLSDVVLYGPYFNKTCSP